MNILYIAPYRNSVIYNECLNNIKTLNTKSSITIYPVYLDSELIDPDQEIKTLESKNICSENYDIVLQHAPVEYLVPFSGLVKNNYCIPIIKYCKNIDSRHINKLLDFNLILSDSKYDADFINSCIGNKSKKVKLFNYTNHYDNNKQVNLFYHNKNYKLYTFINKKNIHNLHKIFLAFFIASQDAANCSLVLAVDSDNLAPQAKTILDDIIKKTKINNIENSIKIVVVPNKPDNVIAMHKTGDCYIEFRETTNSHFHTFIAKECNNTFITNENLDFSYEPTIDNDQDFYNLYPKLSVSSLVNKIKNIVRTKSIHKIDNIPTLDEVICK